MSVRRILAITNGVLEAAAEQRGAARDPARRAERLRSAGPNVVSVVRDVPRVSMARVVADAPGKQLARALLREVSAPDFPTASGRSSIPFADAFCKVRNPWLPGLS